MPPARYPIGAHAYEAFYYPMAVFHWAVRASLPVASAATAIAKDAEQIEYDTRRA